MKPVAGLALLLALSSGCVLAASLEALSAEPMNMQVKGQFDVKVMPQQADNDEARGAGISRLSLDKRFHGPLDASSQGEMLALGDGVEAGAYVAIERITGTLDGRSGSFALVHRALMNRGVPEHWSVLIVPDSGTGELAGIDGSMKIIIADGHHHYEFDYSLPVPPEG
jgi:hypothetical protein